MEGYPADRRAWTDWRSADRAAQAAANAGKEGGFRCFGDERVSAGERQMLDQVRAALGVA